LPLPPPLQAAAAWTFEDLFRLETLEELFDDPIPDPASGPPPFGVGFPSNRGFISGPMVGRSAVELAAALTGLETAAAAALVEFGSLWLSDRVVLDPSRVVGEESFRLNLPAYSPRIFYEIDPARVVLADGDLIIYHKEAGRPSQGVPHDARNNVLAAMERHTGLELRLSHRLDAPTSGLLMMAVTRQAAGRLGLAFRRGAVRKRYLALSQGPPPSFTETMVDAPVGKEDGRYRVFEPGRGLSARTRLTVLSRQGERTLFLAEPLTGRTHQIRLHLASLGHPIVGDDFYGGRPGPRLMLRASGLRLRHPGDARRLVLGGPWTGAEISE
jgi:23S rRNA pseudouridine1911/1915/1917 synthase